MKKRIITILIVFALANSMVFTNAFVVNTKAVSSEKKIANIVEGLEDSVDDFHKTHIRGKDGSRTVIDTDYKKIKSRKKKTNLPSKYMAPYTSVKDQGYFGSCWMFGEMSSLESNLMNKAGYEGGLVQTDPIDLSEAQGVFVQLYRQTAEGTIGGTMLTDSDNDAEILHDTNYYGYSEGGWVFDASMAVSADKGAAFESENTYRSTAKSRRTAESKAMAETAASQYRLNHYNINAANGLPEVFSVVEEGNNNKHREYNPEVRSIWKEQIVENGALSANYLQSTDIKYNHSWGRDSEQYEKPPDFWIYDANASGKYSTNHVITIVGFDDDYSRYHFIEKYTSQSYDSLVATKVYIKTENNEPDVEFDEDGHLISVDTSETAQEGYQAYIVPKEDGAWHIKNSYGTGTPSSRRYDDGIMHMSYCEQTLSEVISSVVEEDLNQIQNEEKTYNATLTHSSLMGNVGKGFASGSKAAEVYRISSENDFELGQIGYWTGCDNTTSRLKIYSELSDTEDPESGSLVYDSGNVVDPYSGYHSLDLEDKVTLTQDTDMSVVITQESDDDCVIMMELDYANTAEAYYSFNSNRGDTFYYDGNNWIDSIDFDEQAREQGYTVGNSTVKLFGNDVPNIYTVTVDGNETEVEEGQNFTFPTTSANGYANDDYSTLYASGQTITPEEDITVSSIGNVDFVMQSGASIDLTGRDGIRFMSQASYADDDFLNSDNVEFGTLMTMEDIFDETFDGDLNLESQAQYGSTYAVRVVNEGWRGNHPGNFAAGIIYIRNSNWDRKLIARAYMIIKYSDNSEKVIYSGYSGRRSIVQVAEGLRDAGYPHMTQEQIDYIQKFLN
ncbi:MAG: hypothetical protein K6E58_01435 [Eubacterium sp.]|nr:hypothetical protein [Eubacterium sp.]